MGRALRIAIVAAATGLAGIAAPSAAIAGTFTWAQPGDLTTTAPGANPESKFGAASWSYSAAPASSFQFSAGFAGGLSGWSDDPSSPTTWVAVSGSAPSSLEMLPAAGGSVSLSWTSPFAQSESVSVQGAVDAPGNAPSCGVNWALTSGGSSIQSGSGSGTIGQTSATVAPGGVVTLTITDASAPGGYTRSCDLAEVGLQISATGAAPAVTLTSPSDGSLYLGGAEPTFGGAAATGFGVDGTVTLDVYSGTSASGTPVQEMTVDGSGGGYLVPETTTLPDGVYTVEASQNDLASPADTGSSGPVRFRISTVAPTLTLNAPGSGPLTSASPTLTGMADGSTPQATLVVYPGADTLSSPARFIGATVASDGSVSVKLFPALADGQYTAVLFQSSASGGQPALSAPVSFSIKVHAPALTITQPLPGGNEPQSSIEFAGAAGHVYGDSQSIDVSVYSGPAVAGKPIGTMVVTADGGSWQATWPKALPLGIYTVRVQQADDAHHETARASTFLVIPGSMVIGSQVQITGAGRVSAPITCPASTGSCAGDVLIVTSNAFRPVPGGPVGELRVMFAHFIVAAGDTVVVARRLSQFALGALRHAGLQRVNVSVLIAQGSAKAKLYTATRLVRVGG